MDTMPISALVKGSGGAAAVMGENTNPAMDAVQGFAQALQNAEDQAKASVTTGKDPHDLVAALSESKLAVETMVAVRDKVVEAYQEILRMQV